MSARTLASQKHETDEPAREREQQALARAARAPGARGDAPSAARTATSRWRAVARASSRFATFTPAISSTSATAALSTSSAWRTLPTTCSWSGTMLNVSPPFGG